MHHIDQCLDAKIYLTLDTDLESPTTTTLSEQDLLGRKDEILHPLSPWGGGWDILLLLDPSTISG